jgi:pyruvate/2-oxoglutarate dehydrogenase complex dihydrolipoamide dehydrogenase (E3) component
VRVFPVSGAKPHDFAKEEVYSMNLAKAIEVPSAKSPASESAAQEYDLVVLGSGEAGKYLAWTLGKQDKRVALIERKYIGGSCPNIACLPSKNVIHSAKVASYFGRAAEFGINLNAFTINMAKVRERKRQMVHDLVEIHLANFKSSGVELIVGNGVFVAPHTIEVEFPSGGIRTVRGEKIVVSTGSQAAVDDIPGLLAALPMTHVELLELDYVPRRLIVLGGGFVGLELAQAMRRFGSEVTVIDRHDRLLYREDDDVSREMQQLMEAEGIQLHLGATVLDVSGQSGDSVNARIITDGVEASIEGTDMLVATGRIPKHSVLSNAA